MPARSHPVSRLEAFSDAVFAFALTLLVVSLEVPRTIDQLMNLMRGFLPFAVTFAMVCYLWYEHNKFFRRYGLEDAWTVVLNSVLLFVVLFYVYPLKYLANSLLGGMVGVVDAPRMQSGQLLMYMYSGGVVLVFSTFVALYWHAWRRRRNLDLDASELVTLRFGRRAHLISVGIGLFSLALNYLTALPGLAGMIYFLMGPMHGWNGYLAHKAHDKLEVRSQKSESAQSAELT
jgi:glucan phosphoethanolaminetransferase (alkaline phosphatase superfamily)